MKHTLISEKDTDIVSDTFSVKGKVTFFIKGINPSSSSVVALVAEGIILSKIWEPCVFSIDLGDANISAHLSRCDPGELVTVIASYRDDPSCDCGLL